MTSSPARIAIIGSGPAGLTAGVILHKHNIPFTIYELRPKPTDEELAKPSGMLDLHEESGIAALKECGLGNEFLKLTGECSEAQIVMDQDGNVLHTDDGGPEERPEISRHALTKLLLSHVPADQIKWEHKLVSATSTASEIELDFGPSGKQMVDLVIGADGAWSKVRSLLTDIRPFYSGTQIITATIRQVTSKYPHLAELVGPGSLSALGTRHGVMTQRGPQDSARIYVALTTADEHFATMAGLAGKTAAEAKQHLLGDPALLGTWAPRLKDLVAAAFDEDTADRPGAAMDIRPLYMLPVGVSWEHRPGATVVGDAAHLMCPWAGEGVNLAMLDSLLLAQAVVAAHENGVESFHNALEPLLKKFETDLVKRAMEKAEETVANGQMMFGDDGARAFANFFLSMGPPPE